MATIRLQDVNGYLYPTDAVSAEVLEQKFHLGRIPDESLDIFSAKIIRAGHSMAVIDYTPQTHNFSLPYSPKIGGKVHSVDNPCDKCRLNGICADECGRKLFRLHSKN